MAQGADKNDPLVKAQRKLARAQLKLHVAEEKHAQVREQGKQEIEKARLRAQRWLSKSAKRVEQRVASVMRAEDRVQALTASPEPAPADAIPDSVAAVAAPVEEQEPVASPGLESANGLVERDVRALEALRQVSREDGVTVREWRMAAGMSETTFARARKTLLDRGLVYRDGALGKDARYILTESGGLYD